MSVLPLEKVLSKISNFFVPSFLEIDFSKKAHFDQNYSKKIPAYSMCMSINNQSLSFFSEHPLLSSEIQ